MTYYRSGDEARTAGIAYHLAPARIWEDAKPSSTYAPESFAADGFLHCAQGIDTLLAVANAFYRTDSREYRVLVIDLQKVVPEVRYDDSGEDFPHLYGPLNTDSVVAVWNALRDSDGSFVDVETGS